MRIQPYLSILCLLIVLPFHCTHLNEARDAFAEKDYRQAINLCKRTIDSDSTDAEAYTLLGKSYHALDSLNLALEATKRAHKLKPNSSEILKEYTQIHIDLGDQALSKENVRKALSHYSSAETLLPNHVNTLQRIADLYFGLGWLDKAQSKYENLLQLTQDSTLALAKLSEIEKRSQKAHSFYRQGLNALKRKKLQTAKLLFSKALKEKSDFTDARYHLHVTEGRLLFTKGPKSALWDAIEAFGKAASLRSEAAEPHFRMAQAYEKKDPDEFINAIDEYETALRLEPKGPFAETCKKRTRELKKRKDKLERFWGRKK